MDNKNSFELILEKIQLENQQKQIKNEELEKFDFSCMFVKLESKLKDYRRDHNKKIVESENNLSLVSLTS